IRTWNFEQTVETETLFLHDERINTAYPYAFLPAQILTTTLLRDVHPKGQWYIGYIPEFWLGRVELIKNRHRVRPLHGGSTYAVFNERTETFTWEEQLKLGSLAQSVDDPFDHLSGIDIPPTFAPRHRTIDPTYDNYGNVIAQIATTEGGVKSEFTLDPEPPN